MSVAKLTMLIPGAKAVVPLYGRRIKFSVTSGVKKLGPTYQKQLLEYRAIKRADDNPADVCRAACSSDA
jgi:hypothetical protein